MLADGVTDTLGVIVMLGVIVTDGVIDIDGVTDTLGVIVILGVTEGVTDGLGRIKLYLTVLLPPYGSKFSN